MLERFHLLDTVTALAASQTSGAQNWFDTGVSNDFSAGQLGKGGALELLLTSDPGGTNPTIQVILQDAPDNGAGAPGSFYDNVLSPVYGGAAPNPAKQSALAKTTALAKGDRITIPLPPGVARHISYRVVIGGTTPSFSFRTYLRAK